MPGNNLVLTLDTRLQQAAEAVLIDEIDFWNTFPGKIRSKSGVGVALKPQNCLLYTTYAADEKRGGQLRGFRAMKKKQNIVLA